MDVRESSAISGLPYIGDLPVKQWLILIVGSVAAGLAWAGLWAAIGALIRIVDQSGSLDALWLGPAVGAWPGFVAGVVFSGLLGVAVRPHRFHELSLSTAVACGGMVGLMLGALPFGINKPPVDSPLWLVAAVVVGVFTLTGAFSAAGSLAVVRMATARRRQPYTPKK
jgi:hypothetical protein